MLKYGIKLDTHSHCFNKVTTYFYIVKRSTLAKISQNEEFSIRSLTFIFSGSSQGVERNH